MNCLNNNSINKIKYINNVSFHKPITIQNNILLNYIMPGSHLFNLGLFQKNFNSTSKITGPAINVGCTRGRGSTTRMLNYCNKTSPNSSLCINQFITKSK
jgi:hypothetical protein